jgi:mannose-6-phosphate isomerase-like protein (cupin superfamily)
MSSSFVLPKDVRHDLRNTGTVPLLAIAFFRPPGR